MKKFAGLFLLLFVVFVGFYGPSAAYGFEEEVYIFQTMDDPAVPPDIDVLNEALNEWNINLKIDNVEQLPPGFLPLGASLWAVNTRNKDGKIVKEKVRQVGTGTAVTIISDDSSDFSPFGPLAPFYFKANVGEMEFTAAGYGIVIGHFGGAALVGCNLVVADAPDKGILGGSATSNSVLPLVESSVYQTGSFWTVRLLKE